MSKDEAKLAFYSLLAETPDLSLPSVVQKLNIPLTTLKEWQRSYLNLPDSAVEASDLVLDHTPVPSVQAEPPMVVEAVTERDLKGDLEGAAVIAVSVIANKLEDLKTLEGAFVGKEMTDLVASLTSIQTAFCAKPTPVVGDVNVHASLNHFVSTLQP